MKFSMGQKISAGIGLALLLLSVTSVVASRAMTHFAQQAERVEQSWRVLKKLGEVSGQLLAVELRQRNYLLTGNESELETYHATVGAIPREIEDLRQLTRDNPNQQRSLNTLEPLITKARAELDAAIDARKRNSPAGVPRVVGGQDEQALNSLRQIMGELQSEELELLQQRHEEFGAAAQRMVSLVVIRNVLALLYVVVSGLIIYRDVAARTRTEAALRESEARLTAQYKGIPIPTYTWQRIGEEFVCVDYNEAAAAFTRGGMANFLGKPASQTHQARPEFLQMLQQCFTEKRPIKGETFYRLLSTGEDKRLAVTCAFIPPDLLIVHTEDVTERKRAEEALHRSEEYFRSLTENATDIVSILNIDGTIRSQSPSGERVLGYTEAELAGQNAFEFVHPEDVAKLLQVFTEGLQIPGHIAIMEFRFRHKDGSWRILEGIGKNLLDNPAVRGVVINSRDITERKHAQAELERLKYQQELILRSVADGINVLDPQGKVSFVNPAAARMIGYGSEELIGRPMHETLHHSKSDGTPYLREDCPISATLRDGSLHHATNEVFWRRDGTSFPVEYTSAPIREQGEVAGTVVTFRDISERRVVERLKDEFISVVSHELRTPLTSIRGALGLLTSGLVGALPDKGQRMLEIAVNNTDRLVRLINDILDIERMQSGKVIMQRQLCDAATLLVQATDEMRGLAEKAGITLVVTPQALPLWADPDRIVQTLTNLLSNAIKFSPTGGTVWVNVARQGEEAVFTVRDQGRGIPADKLESIFERFQQVDASDSRKKGGTGLGLAICRSIVQQHGGRIWVESTVGQGSTFYFTLPAQPETERSMSTLPGQPLVLVCDDDPSVLEVVGTMLAQHGYRVLTAASGQEAVEQALVTRPAAILLDLLMPGMSGWETMAVLKGKPATSDIPIIILSGVQRQKGGSLPSTVVDWVDKPLNEGVLFQALERALAGYKGKQVLVVEDDPDFAKILLTMFERHGIDAAHARTSQEAVRLCAQLRPVLLVLDLTLPDSDGFAVVDWLRRQDQFQHIPLVVYSAKDLDDGERHRLQLDHTEFFTKGRITPEEFEKHVVSLLTCAVPKAGDNLSGRALMPVGQ